MVLKKKSNANLRENSMNIVHDNIERNESILPITNH